MIKALQQLGFTDAMEVSLGADATAYYEAQEAKEVAREGGHMTTSCCPAFLVRRDGYFLRHGAFA